MSTDKKSLSPEDLVIYRRNEQERNELNIFLTKLEAELRELDLVLEKLSKLENTRVCHRLIEGVLVKESCEETTAALKKKKSSLQEKCGTIEKQISDNAKEISELAFKYNLVDE